MGFRSKEDAIHFAEKQGQFRFLFHPCIVLMLMFVPGRVGLLCVSLAIGWAVPDH